MTLSALIKKGGLADRMAATVATVATQETDQPVNAKDGSLCSRCSKDGDRGGEVGYL